MIRAGISRGLHHAYWGSDMHFVLFDYLPILLFIGVAGERSLP
jgi:hypothetical protein